MQTADMLKATAVLHIKS